MNVVRAERALAINFAATIFVSAFLLFQVQPLISKYILPWFGGTPAVWTTCMLFFQSLLFAGYAYAHFSQQWLKPKQQAAVHLGLIVLAILFLRVTPDDSWKPLDSNEPIARILGLLMVSVGLPYFVLSSTGPLVQAWFARAFPGRAPYRLYALSNVGSLLALLSYPFWFERVFDSHEQARFWQWGFVVYAALCGYAAVSLWMMFRGQNNAKSDAAQAHDTKRTPTQAHGLQSVGLGNAASSAQTATAEQTTEQSPRITPPHWWQYILWLALPAFASVALLATTNHICADVAVMPFLWVIPLSLYLLTFIVAFDHPRWYRRGLTAAFTLLMLYAVAVIYRQGMGTLEVYGFGTPGKVYQVGREAMLKAGGTAVADLPESPELECGYIPTLAVSFGALFGLCLLCHGELVRLRPHPKYLTGFYLMISAGGALGGLAVSLVAPNVFTWYVEWNIVLGVGYALALGIAVFSAAWWVAKSEWNGSVAQTLANVGLGLLLFAALVGAWDFQDFLHEPDKHVVHRVRNFFGTLTVKEHDQDKPRVHDFTLVHGAIKHGVQFTHPDKRHKPTTYYSEASGVGRAIGYYRQHPDLKGMRIGAVGLGVGTLAAYAGEGDAIRFYEINPAVIEIAEDKRWFSYLRDSRTRGATCDTVLGDARLTLERELAAKQPGGYHVLVLDAFSGDAIPAHLLTEEAMTGYAQHLATSKDGGEAGALAIHVTNRHVDLEPVVRGLAEKFGLKSVRVINHASHNEAINYADWIILTNNAKLLAELAPHAATEDDLRDDGAAPPGSKPAVLWTDRKSDLFGVLK